MKSISDTIANTLLLQGIIQKEDVYICKYGLGIFISSILEILSILIISFFIGNPFETILFFASFVPLRIYAGGYHANTKMSCYLLSLIVYTLFTAMIYILPQSLYVIMNLLIAVLSLVVVSIAAPIIHKNKTVNKFEEIHYRKLSIFICVSETLIILILTAVFPCSKYVVSFAAGQSAVIASMLAAIIKRELVVDK